MTTPTNPYYQRRLDVTGGQLARSRQLVQEFQLIQRGFDLIGLQNSVIKYQIACSDLVSEILPGPSKSYFRTTDSFQLKEVRASLLEPSNEGAVRMALTINGFNALFLPLQIDQGQKTSLTSVVKPTIALVDVPDDSEVLVDVVTAGVGAKGLIVTLLGVRTGSSVEDIL